MWVWGYVDTAQTKHIERNTGSFAFPIDGHTLLERINQSWQQVQPPCLVKAIANQTILNIILSRSDGCFARFFLFFSVKSRSILLLAIWIPIYRFYSSSCWGWAAESFGWVRNGKRPESQVGPRVVHLSSIWGFLKWGILKTMGFNTKMVWWLDDLIWGVPILGNLHMIQALPSNITLTSSTLPTTVCCLFFRGQGALKRWTSDNFEKLVLLPSKSIAQDVTLTLADSCYL